MMAIGSVEHSINIRGKLGLIHGSAPDANDMKIYALQVGAGNEIVERGDKFDLG